VFTWTLLIVLLILIIYLYKKDDEQNDNIEVITLKGHHINNAATRRSISNYT